MKMENMNMYHVPAQMPTQMMPGCREQMMMEIHQTIMSMNKMCMEMHHMMMEMHRMMGEMHKHKCD